MLTKKFHVTPDDHHNCATKSPVNRCNHTVKKCLESKNIQQTSIFNSHKHKLRIAKTDQNLHAAAVCRKPVTRST